MSIFTQSAASGTPAFLARTIAGQGSGRDAGLLEGLGAQLAASRKLAVEIGFHDPEAWIAAELAAGATPDVVMAQWMTGAATATELAGRYRRRVTLAATATPLPGPSEPGMMALAGVMLATRPGAAELRARLTGTPAPDPDAALSALARHLADTTVSLVDGPTGPAALARALAAQVGELETVLTATHKRASHARAELRVMEQRGPAAPDMALHDDLRAALGQSRSAHEGTRQSLYRANAGLRQDLRRLAARTDEAEAETARLRENLDRIHGSTSWRITAPLRRVVLWLRGDR